MVGLDIILYIVRSKTVSGPSAAHRSDTEKGAGVYTATRLLGFPHATN